MTEKTIEGATIKQRNNEILLKAWETSWSIKAVLPVLCPELSYAELDGVQDGEMAVEAFKEAIATETSAERKQEVQQQLLKYCELDTFGMVRMWQIFSGPSL